MKRFIALIGLALLFGSVSLQAAPVSPSQAMDIAKKVFASQPATKAGTGTLKLVWDGEDVATKAAQPAFYVIARDGGGFVIVAGDDNVTPILAISDRNEFKVEGMPENVKWWMDRMKAYVRASKKQSLDVKSQWTYFISTKDASIKDPVTVVKSRLTPEWNQHDPYNDACPEYATNKRTLTGCVALAISEILSYQAANKDEMGITMPAKGTGTVGGYAVHFSGFIAPASYDLSTHSYDWETIASFVASSATSEQKANLAMLIADIGAIVEAEYSADATSANSLGVAAHMAEHFYFNKAAVTEYASSYSSRNWISKLKAEIDQRPVFYFGQSNAGGHAFVFDGYGTYNTNDVFHVNFGWGGANNGYYYYTNLDTSDLTNGSEDWSTESGAIFGFYPDKNSEYTVQLRAEYVSETYPGIRAFLDNDGDIVMYYAIKNCSLTDYSGQIKFVLKKRDNTETLLSSISLGVTNPLDFNISVGETVRASDGYFHSVGEVSLGDKIICYYKDGDNWSLLNAIPGSAISEWPLKPAAFIVTDSSYSKNSYFSFALKNNDYIYKDATWVITRPDGTQSTYSQSDREFQLTSTGKYKIAVTTSKETIVTYIIVN